MCELIDFSNVLFFYGNAHCSLDAHETVRLRKKGNFFRLLFHWKWQRMRFATDFDYVPLPHGNKLIKLSAQNSHFPFDFYWILSFTRFPSMPHKIIIKFPQWIENKTDKNFSWHDRVEKQKNCTKFLWWTADAFNSYVNLWCLTYLSAHKIIFAQVSSWTKSCVYECMYLRVAITRLLQIDHIIKFQFNATTSFCFDWQPNTDSVKHRGKSARSSGNIAIWNCLFLFDLGLSLHICGGHVKSPFSIRELTFIGFTHFAYCEKLESQLSKQFNNEFLSFDNAISTHSTGSHHQTKCNSAKWCTTWDLKWNWYQSVCEWSQPTEFCA